MYTYRCLCLFVYIQCIHAFLLMYTQAGDLSVVGILIIIEGCGVIHVGFGRRRVRGQRRRVAGRAATSSAAETEQYARQEDGAGDADREGEGERARGREGERARDAHIPRYTRGSLAWTRCRGDMSCSPCTRALATAPGIRKGIKHVQDQQALARVQH